MVEQESVCENVINCVMHVAVAMAVTVTVVVGWLPCSTSSCDPAVNVTCDTSLDGDVCGLWVGLAAVLALAMVLASVTVALAMLDGSDPALSWLPLLSRLLALE